MRIGPVIVALAALASTPPAPAAEPTGARLIAQRIVAYERAGGGVSRSAAFLDLFAPRLRALIERDLGGDEAGVLDYDPFCQCQDNDGLTIGVVSVSGTDSAAVLILENRFPQDRNRVTYRLARAVGTWKIADISSAAEPSLYRRLAMAKAR